MAHTKEKETVTVLVLTHSSFTVIMCWVCMVQPQLSLHLLTFSLGYVLEGSSYQFLTEVTGSS